MSESPHYLVKINDKEGAMSNLTRLSGITTEEHQVERWINEVQKTLKTIWRTKTALSSFVKKKRISETHLYNGW